MRLLRWLSIAQIPRPRARIPLPEMRRPFDRSRHRIELRRLWPVPTRTEGEGIKRARLVTKEFGDEMYFCLGCLACKTACPSGVDYTRLFETARATAETAIPTSLQLGSAPRSKAEDELAHCRTRVRSSSAVQNGSVSAERGPSSMATTFHPSPQIGGTV